jgi:hypothetical protein
MAVIYAVFVATYRLDLPGLYYDEVLYLPYSFYALGECGSFATLSSHWGNCFPLLLSPFYLGALKAYLYAPLVAVFPVSAELVRLPPMVLAILVAALSYLFFAPRIGRPWAALAAVLLLTSPVYLWHARIDWGPFILGAAFRFLVLAFVIRWVETGRPSQLALAGAAFTLGLYDKLNFVWLLLPLAAALVLVYPREMLVAVKARPRTVAIIAALCSAIGLFFLFYGIIPALRMQLYPRGQTVLENAWGVIGLLRVSFSGAAQAGWMFNTPVRIQSFLATVFFGQLVIGTIVMAFALLICKRLAKDAVRWGQVKLFFALHILLVGCTITLMMSADVTGSHHAVFLLPLTAFQAAAMLSVVGLAGQTLMPPCRIAITSLLAILVIAVVGEQLRVGVIYLELLQRDARAYNPNFTPEIYRLAHDVERLGIDQVISVDWGTHMQLVSLAPAGHRDHYRDYWPFFSDANPAGRKTNAILERVATGTTAVFVTKPQNRAVMGKATANFRAALEALPACALAETKKGSFSELAFTVVVVKNNCR